jgi:hypothetical protein
MKVRNSLLTIEYTAIYVYNYSVSSARRFYGFSDYVLGFIVATLSLFTISCAFTLRGSRGFTEFHNLASTNSSDTV